jgi:F1F0 ATPase subunit 2
MNDIPALALVLLAGALLGAFFFGGLWWTVHKGVTSDWPALWFLGSLLVRTGVILGGFYVVAQGHWSRLVACLLGFLIARVIVTKWLSRAPVGQAFQPDKPKGVRPDNRKGVRLESLTYDKETNIAPHSR